MRRILSLIFFAGSMQAQPLTITWTKVWNGPTSGTVGAFYNGYEDIHWASLPNVTMLYTTNIAADANQNFIYSSRLGYNSGGNTYTFISSNGQQQNAGCYNSIDAGDTFPDTQHIVGQFWHDSIRNRVWVLPGVAGNIVPVGMWYYQLTNPMDNHTDWVRVTGAANFPTTNSNITGITLSASITSSDTSITINNPASIANGSTFLIGTELVRVTGGGGRQCTGGANGANPLTITRAQYGTTAASHNSGDSVILKEGLFSNAVVVHDPDDDVFILFGLPKSGSSFMWAYCDTSVNPTPGTLTSAQSTAGCSTPDAWTNITSQVNCSDASCVSTGGGHGVPSGYYYPNMRWDATNHRIIKYGGLSGCCMMTNQVWHYTPSAKTWTPYVSGLSGLNSTYTTVNRSGSTVTFDAAAAKTVIYTLDSTDITSSSIVNGVLNDVMNIKLCRGSTSGTTFAWPTNVVDTPYLPNSLSGSGSPNCTLNHFKFDGTNWNNLAPPVQSNNTEGARIAVASCAGYFFYHMANRPAGSGTSISGSPKDYVMDLTTGVWSLIQTGQGPSATETMTCNVTDNKLVSWASGTGATVWEGVFASTTPPTISTSSIPAGNQYTPYSTTLAASDSPTSWALASGTLPTGITLDTTSGVISGTSVYAGRYAISVIASNGGGDSSPQSLTLDLAASPGLGHSTYDCVDVDGDLRGVGEGCLGADADDTDTTVYTEAQALAKWGDLATFWSHMGWTPTSVLYVSPGQTGTCTAITTPFAYDATKVCNSVSAAISAQSAGQAVVLRGGAYSMGGTSISMKNGTVEAGGTGVCINDAYYLSYPGEQPVLTWSGSNGLSGAVGLSNGQQGCYVVDGWKVATTNLGFGRPFGAGQDAPTYGIQISHVESTGWTVGIFAPSSQSRDGKYRHNYVHHIYCCGDEGHGIYLGSHFTVNGPGGIIQGNVFHHITDACIHMNGPWTGFKIDSNLLYGCGIGINAQSGYNHSDITNNVFYTQQKSVTITTYANAYASNTFQCHDQNYNFIAYNSFFTDNQYWGTASDPAGVRNATASDAGHPVIHLADYNGESGGGPVGWCKNVQPSGLTPDAGHNYYVGNIMEHYCGTHCYQGGTTNPNLAGPVIRYNSANDPAASTQWLQTDTFINNLMVNRDVTGRMVLSDQGGQQNSTWFAANANPSNSGNVFDVNPLHVSADWSYWTNASLFDLRVASGSPAIGAGYAGSVVIDGVTRDMPTYDAIGVPRSPTAPTAGAYEAQALAAGNPALVGGKFIGGTIR